MQSTPKEQRKQNSSNDEIVVDPEAELGFYYPSVPLDETEQELIHVYLEQGEEKKWIAKKLGCTMNLLQDYIDIVRKAKAAREKARKEENKRRAEEKKRLDEQKKAVHTGSYWLGDRVLADYYGIGTYFEGVIQSKNYDTGLYNVKFPSTGATQDLPSPKIRKWRKAFVEGERLDSEDEAEAERLRKRRVEEEKRKKAEEELQQRLAEEAEEAAKKDPERELAEQRKRAEDHLRKIKEAKMLEEKRDQDRKFTFMYDTDLGKCRVDGCACLMFEKNNRDEEKCDRCWHEQTDHSEWEKHLWRVGDQVSYSSLTGWKHGVITMIYPDKKFQVKADDGSPVPRLVKDQLRCRKAKFDCGHKVEYMTMKGWINARVYEHNINGTYQLRLDPDHETVIGRVRESLINPRERGPKWICEICEYSNKFSMLKCEICQAPQKNLQHIVKKKHAKDLSEVRKADYLRRKELEKKRKRDQATKASDALQKKERAQQRNTSKMKKEEVKKKQDDRKKFMVKKKKAQLTGFLQKVIANKLRLSKKDTYWDLSDKGITDNDCIMVGFYLTQTKSGCPGKHNITTFKTPTGTWFCSVCEGDDLPTGTRMFGCRICDWDCCRNCFMINCRLNKLDVNESKIGDKGAHAIGRALKTNSTLTILRMEHNNIGDAGAQTVGRGLKKNKTLKKLSISYNQIGDNGSWVIAKGLKLNKTLETLNLEHNEIGDLGGEGFGAALEKNTTLIHLNLNNNNIGEIGSQCIGVSLVSNSTLKELHLQKNQIWNIGTEHIALGLGQNIGLTILDLNGNYIASEGAQKLADALRSNKTLKELHLRGNSLSDGGKNSLHNAKEDHPKLEVLLMDATLELDTDELDLPHYKRSMEEEELRRKKLREINGRRDEAAADGPQEK